MVQALQAFRKRGGNGARACESIRPSGRSWSQTVNTKSMPGGTGFGEFSPALAPQMRSWHAEALKQIEGYRVDFTLRKAPGAVALESALAPMVDDGLGQDAPR